MLDVSNILNNGQSAEGFSGLNISDILSYGITGLGFLLALLCFRLIIAEQKKETPRKSIIRTIYSFMLFSIGLCVLGVVSQREELAADVLAPGTSLVEIGHDVRLKRFGHEGINNFFKKYTAERLVGKWTSEWFDESGKPLQIKNEKGKKSDYKDELLELKSDGSAAIWAVNFDPNSLSLYWYEGIYSEPLDLLTMHYWDGESPYVGTVFLKLEKSFSKMDGKERLSLKGNWIGYYSYEGRIVKGTTVWHKSLN